jgi:hydroxylamine reductase (hybrid-cluster protein)
VVSHYVAKQITFLKAPRSLTSEQIDTISSGLKDKPTAIFQVTTLSTSDESLKFGGQLQKILKAVGWQSMGLTQYYMDEGEAPPMGVNVIVDGHDSESVKSAERLTEVFRTAGIQGVRFSSNTSRQIASTWVLIEVGHKPNH